MDQKFNQGRLTNGQYRIIQKVQILSLFRYWLLRGTLGYSVSISDLKRALNSNKLTTIKWTIILFDHTAPLVDRRWFTTLEIASPVHIISNLESYCLNSICSKMVIVLFASLEEIDVSNNRNDSRKNALKHSNWASTFTERIWI